MTRLLPDVKNMQRIQLQRKLGLRLTSFPANVQRTDGPLCTTPHNNTTVPLGTNTMMMSMSTMMIQRRLCLVGNSNSNINAIITRSTSALLKNHAGALAGASTAASCLVSGNAGGGSRMLTTTATSRSMKATSEDKEEVPKLSSWNMSPISRRLSSCARFSSSRHNATPFSSRVATASTATAAATGSQLRRMSSSSSPLSLYTWGTNKNNCCLVSAGPGSSKEGAPAGGDSADASSSGGSTVNILWEPQLVSDLDVRSDVGSDASIAGVTCGSSSNTAVVLTNGDVFVVGENKNGELGLGHKDPVPSLTKIPDLPPIRRVEFGPYTSAFIATNGELYTCGFGGSLVNGMGSLGHGNSESLLRPKLVSSLVEDGCTVTQVQLGESHSTVLTSEGEVLTCGTGSYGRLGNGEATSDDQLYFDVVEIINENAVQIAGGKSFTLALSQDGVVYGWGRNHKGQLGTGFGMAVDMYSMEQIPTPIDGDELINRTVKKIAAGHSHAACISDSGEMFWWGMSLNLEPVRVAEVLHTKIVDVVCGQDYTMALSEDHHIYIWGAGKTGVLGVGSTTKTLHQAQMIKSLAEYEIESMSAGWTHAACLVKKK